MSKQIVPHSDPLQLPLIPDPDLSKSPFESIKHTDAYGEYWLARELQPLLEYSKWDEFSKAIGRAKEAIRAIGHNPKEVIAGTRKHLVTKQGAQREIADFRLTRYACYMIAMNSDSRKEAVALAQTYFAVQTRRQELSDQEKIDKQIDKRQRDIVAYQVKGKRLGWSESRVDEKDSGKEFRATLRDTHKDHDPNYSEIGGIQNRGLFNMTKAQIVEYLGLLPKDAPKFHDFLGEYALDAFKQVNRTCELRMKSLNRILTSEEQADIVRHVVTIVAPTMHKLAEFARVDFASGAQLDANGKPLINRNVKLLK